MIRLAAAIQSNGLLPLATTTERPQLINVFSPSISTFYPFTADLSIPRTWDWNLLNPTPIDLNAQDRADFHFA